MAKKRNRFPCHVYSAMENAKRGALQKDSLFPDSSLQGGLELMVTMLF